MDTSMGFWAGDGPSDPIEGIKVLDSPMRSSVECANGEKVSTGQIRCSASALGWLLRWDFDHSRFPQDSLQKRMPFNQSIFKLDEFGVVMVESKDHGNPRLYSSRMPWVTVPTSIFKSLDIEGHPSSLSFYAPLYQMAMVKCQSEAQLIDFRDDVTGVKINSWDEFNLSFKEFPDDVLVELLREEYSTELVSAYI